MTLRSLRVSWHSNARSKIVCASLICLFISCSRNAPPSVEKSLKGSAEYDQEIKLYTEVVARDSNNSQAWFSLGKAHFYKSKALGRDRYGDVPIAAFGEMELAAQAYDRALRLAPHQINDDQLDEFGEVYSFLNNYAWYRSPEDQGEAIRQFGSRVRKAARADSSSARAWLVLSKLYPWEDDLRQYCLSKAIEIDPTCRDAYVALASSAGRWTGPGLRHSRYTNAHIYYRQLTRLGTLTADDLSKMISFYDTYPVSLALLESYRDSLKVVPSLVRVLFEVGMWPFVKDEHDRLPELGTRLLSIDSSNETLGLLAWKALERGDTSKALEFYFRYPFSPWGYSKRIYEKAIAMKPLFGPAYAQLARGVKDQDSVISLLQKATSLEKTDPSRYYRNLSWAYQSKGNLEMAIFWEEKWFEEISHRGFPVYSTWSAFSSLASLYLQKHDVDAVRRLIQRGMKIKGIDLVRSILFALTNDIDPKNIRLSDLEAMIETKLGLSPEYKSLAYSYLGDAHQKDTVKQLNYLRRAMDLQPSNEDARRYVLTDDIQRGNYTKVLAILRQWHDAKTSYTFGEELRSKGKTSESDLFYSIANEMDPDLAVEAFEEARMFPPQFKYATEQYQKAARLGYRPAKDTLSARNIGW